MLVLIIFLILTLLISQTMNQTELLTELTNLKAQVVKTGEETKSALVKLEAAIAAQGTVSPEVETALSELKAVVQANDDLIADTTEGGE